MRKTWKRALGLLLALCLLVSAMPAALAAGGSDLRGHWAEAAFTAFVEAGYVNGYPDGSYRPDQFVTRAEFMKLVNQVAGLTATSAAVQQYKDVKSSAWYYNEVSKALAEGYIQGKSANLMEPEANITRQEAITMVARVSGLKNGNLSVLQQYADRDQLAQWAEDAAAAMTEAQRLEGDPDHNLRPLDLLTRAEAVTLLNRCLDLLQPTGVKTVVSTSIWFPQKPEKPEMVYVLMNIPYADFYEAEVRNEVEVDAVTSATLNKTRTGTLAGGSYHVKSDGSEITGITFPVLVSKQDLENYKQVTDADRVEITVTNRGQTSTTVYEGKDALFENESYAYYLLAETPAYYKPMELNADGQPVFGKAVGSVETVAADVTLSAESRYGDYQLTVEGLDIDMSADKVYAVVIHTDENDYGLRHVENIWRGTSLAWCTGFTSSVHGSPTSSAHYESMMGQTIRKVTYYTSQGIYEIPAELYVPVKFEGTLSVEDASANAGATTVTVSLPADYDPVYQVEGIEAAAVENGILTYPTDTEPGEYTLTVSDRSGKYVSLSAKFQLTALMPPEATVTYNSFSGAWEIYLGFAEDYYNAVTGVAVNGQPYKKAEYGLQAENGNWFFAGTSPYLIGVKGGQAGDTVTITANGYYTLELTLQK